MQQDRARGPGDRECLWSPDHSHERTLGDRWGEVRSIGRPALGAVLGVARPATDAVATRAAVRIDVVDGEIDAGAAILAGAALTPQLEGELLPIRAIAALGCGLAVKDAPAAPVSALRTARLGADPGCMARRCRGRSFRPGRCRLPAAGACPQRPERVCHAAQPLAAASGVGSCDFEVKGVSIGDTWSRVRSARVGTTRAFSIESCGSVTCRP